MLSSMQSPRRSPRRNNTNNDNKGIKMKHVVQICLLLGGCIWLLNFLAPPASPSRLKSNVRISNDKQVKLGRKDLKPRGDQTLDEIKPQGQDQDQDQGENEKLHCEEMKRKEKEVSQGHAQKNSTQNPCTEKEVTRDRSDDRERKSEKDDNGEETASRNITERSTEDGDEKEINEFEETNSNSTSTSEVISVQVPFDNDNDDDDTLSNDEEVPLSSNLSGDDSIEEDQIYSSSAPLPQEERNTGTLLGSAAEAKNSVK